MTFNAKSSDSKKIGQETIISMLIHAIDKIANKVAFRFIYIVFGNIGVSFYTIFPTFIQII